LLVRDDRALRDLPNFVESPIRQFDAEITDCQPAIGTVGIDVLLTIVAPISKAKRGLAETPRRKLAYSAS